MTLTAEQIAEQVRKLRVEAVATGGRMRPDAVDPITAINAADALEALAAERDDLHKRLAVAESERDLLHANEDTLLGEAKQDAVIMADLRAKLAQEQEINRLVKQGVTAAAEHMELLKAELSTNRDIWEAKLAAAEAERVELDEFIFFRSAEEVQKRIRNREPEHHRQAAMMEIELRAINRHLTSSPP